MPIYPFKCQICDHEFEEFFHINETDKKPSCHHCHHKETIQLMSMPSDWNPASAVFTNKGWNRINEQAALNIRNNDDRK
jgi:putative FmdB family regulatory protein